MGQIKGPKEETAMKSEFWVDSIQSDKSKKTCWNLLSGGEKKTVAYNNYNNNSYKTNKQTKNSSLAKVLDLKFFPEHLSMNTELLFQERFLKGAFVWAIPVYTNGLHFYLPLKGVL